MDIENSSLSDWKEDNNSSNESGILEDVEQSYANIFTDDFDE